MATVLLVRPPVVYSTGTFSSPATPPLGIAYLAAALRQDGHTPIVLDALGEALDRHGPSYAERLMFRGLSIPEIAERAVRLAPDGVDLIGVSAMFSCEWPHTRQVIEAVAGVFPGTPIVVGGEHATAAPGHVLRDCPMVQYVARGEGEETMVDLARFCDGRLGVDEVHGLTRMVDGELVVNANRARMTRLDALPRPAWDLVPIGKYLDSQEGHGVGRGRSMPLLATRGCPYRCTFCSNPQMWTTRYVTRDPVDVVDEICELVTTYGAQNIDFYDLTAVTKKTWILSFCAEMQRRDLNITWQLPSGTRSEAMDDEVLDAMVAAGCTNVTYAPESGSPETLERIKKKVKLDRLDSSIRAAVRRGMSVKCNLIIGFPFEARKDVLQTVVYSLKLGWMGVEDAGLFLFAPYPGSELHEQMRTDGQIAEMSDEYFASLFSYMDINASTSHCVKIGARELAAWRTVGMAGFYLVSYLRRPQRVLRTVRNLRSGSTHSVFETRLLGLASRRRDRRSGEVLNPA